MATLWKKDVEQTVSVDLGSNDIYNNAAGFNLLTKFQDEALPVKQDIEFNEIIEDIGDGISVNASGDSSAGSYIVGVDDTSNIEVGMRFKVTDSDGNDKGIYFYVSKVTTDSITTRRALSGNIVDGDKLEQVGNTGVYEAKITPTKTGDLTFIVNNPTIGLQDQIGKARVINNDIDDVVLNVSSSFNIIDDKLTDIQNALGTAGAEIVTGRLVV